MSPARCAFALSALLPDRLLSCCSICRWRPAWCDMCCCCCCWAAAPLPDDPSAGGPSTHAIRFSRMVSPRLMVTVWVIPGKESRAVRFFALMSIIVDRCQFWLSFGVCMRISRPFRLGLMSLIFNSSGLPCLPAELPSVSRPPPWELGPGCDAAARMELSDWYSSSVSPRSCCSSPGVSFPAFTSATTAPEAILCRALRSLGRGKLAGSTPTSGGG
mmetsp:Transcript_20445/g.56669  ORF Transcript_20445/g.56669 Transcript_20445/m.56669 type:complete len:216 (+) Transcript_20445:590-1237(+)